MRYIPSVIVFLLALPFVVAGFVWQMYRHGFACGADLYAKVWEMTE